MFRYVCNTFFGLLIVFSFFVTYTAHTAPGMVDSTYKYAWGENFGWINFAPVDTSNTYHGLVITDTSVSGYAWSSQFGWINFSPVNGGVTNTCSGELGGWAWSTQLGWIPMSGVVINSSGKFTGVGGSSSLLAGRITFDCALCDVRTDWNHCSAPSLCGNGIVEAGEACDNGVANGACPATCSNSCTVNQCEGGSSVVVSETPPPPPLLDKPLSTTHENVYMIFGTASPNTYIDVYINGVKVEPRWGIAQSDGTFRGLIKIVPGQTSTIYVIGTDQYGNQSVASNVQVISFVPIIDSDALPIVDHDTPSTEEDIITSPGDPDRVVPPRPPSVVDQGPIDSVPPVFDQDTGVIIAPDIDDSVIGIPPDDSVVRDIEDDFGIIYQDTDKRGVLLASVVGTLGAIVIFLFYTPVGQIFFIVLLVIILFLIFKKFISV